MKWLRDNGLTLVLLALFAASLLGQAWAGWPSENEQRSAHDAASLSFASYLASGAFLSALFENWESKWARLSC